MTFLSSEISEQLSQYCRAECRNTCCNFKKNSIGISEEEFLFMFGSGIFKLAAEKFDMDIAQATVNYKNLLRRKRILGKDSRSRKYRIRNIFCPKFDQGTMSCTVYNDPRRPEVCGEYPIAMINEEIVLNIRCEFVAKNWQKIFEDIKKGPKCDAAVAVVDPKDTGHSLRLPISDGYLSNIEKAVTELAKTIHKR